MVDPLTPPDPSLPTAAPSPSVDPTKLVSAEAKEYDPAECAAVSEWISKIDDAEEFWKKPFKKMKDNQDFATMGADKKWVEDGCFRVPILNRHINQSVAVLYARNPRASATRRRQMMFKLWDGRQDTLQAAMNAAMQNADANSIALLEEVAAVVQQDLMLDRMGKTTEILWEYYLNEQSTNYKKQIKAAVRRAKINGVAYIKLVFQRALKLQPEIQAKIEDTTSKIAETQRLLEVQSAGNLDEVSAEAYRLKSLLADLQQQQYIVLREGPVLDFPKSDEVLVDPEVTHMASLTGAHWIAFPYDKTIAEAKKIWGIDLTDKVDDVFGQSTSAADGIVRKPPISAKAGREKQRVKKIRFYEVWDKENQQKFVVCRYNDGFVEAPAAPKPQLSRFWPLFPLVFNEVEHEDHAIPPSDIEQAKPIQMEYNRLRESLRQHRIAARPYYVESGALSPEDKTKLGNHLDHEVLTIPALSANQDIAKLIQRGPTTPIDPNLYEVEPLFKDMLRAVGTQEGNLGGPDGKGTATGQSIAENSRSAQNEDNVDDLDEMLTELSVAAGEMMLMELGKETVLEVVGPGAVWPDMPQTRTDASKHLLLKIEAGSSGRPNSAAELAKLERATPFLVQVPGTNPAPLAKRYAELLDLPIEDFIAEGMPSITSINAMLTKMSAAAGAQQTGDPATSPAAQGMQGGNNVAVQPLNEPGPQPAYPAPAPL